MPYAQEVILPYGNNGEKREQVERMFDHIASRYDLLNHLLSFGIDRGWRRKTIDTLRSLPHDELLDVATGTGDFALLACKRLRPRRVVAVDLSDGMMAVGRKKVAAAGLGDVVSFQREDCTHLSFADAAFDAVTVAYGVRNFDDLDGGLYEMRRVLRDGGHAVILELTAPRRFPMKQLFWMYAHVMMPLVGRLLSHDARAYTYLPKTMEVFPQGERMQQILEKNGFRNVRFRRFTFGLSTMYIAQK